MSALLAKPKAETEDINDLLMKNDILSDVKDVMKELNVFKSSKLDNVKDDLNSKKKEMKLISRLEKLIDLVKDKLPHQVLAQLTCQLIEDYIHFNDKKKMNELKRKIAKQVLQPVLQCNEDVLDIVITLVCVRLKKSTMWRRHKHRVSRLVSSLFLRLASLKSSI